MNGPDGQALPRLSVADYGVQTWGVLVAAYRDLNARKLFWVALALNALVIAAMAAIGIDEGGVSVLGISLPIPAVNTRTFPGASLYTYTFMYLGVGLWLGWLSTILALLSTASIFPDLASGGVDTMLSKPIGRMRLFITKFVSGLLFSALQVTVFALLSFIVIGVRGGEWEWGLFVVVPLEAAVALALATLSVSELLMRTCVNGKPKTWATTAHTLVCRPWPISVPPWFTRTLPSV